MRSCETSAYSSTAGQAWGGGPLLAAIRALGGRREDFDDEPGPRAVVGIAAGRVARDHDVGVVEQIGRDADFHVRDERLALRAVEVIVQPPADVERDAVAARARPRHRVGPPGDVLAADGRVPLARQIVGDAQARLFLR
jgi:hypothetical protein